MNSSDAVESLKNLRNQRMLVMGGVTLDRHLWETLTRVSPADSESIASSLPVTSGV
jgi:bifunctional ADP-heptose synthase (sugar kinase/adenylyltransferase)